jgi:hypothetical protein
MIKHKISLLEMFGTRADIKWSSTSLGEEGSFQLDGQSLKIVLNEYDPIKLSTGTSTGDILEVGFSRTIDGKEVIKKTNTDDSIKVFSVIFNGLVDKFKAGGFPKTLFFSAKKIGEGAEEHEKRTSLYKRLQDRIGRFGYDKIDPIENSTGTQFILTSVKLSKEELEEVKNIVNKL